MSEEYTYRERKVACAVSSKQIAGTITAFRAMRKRLIELNTREQQDLHQQALQKAEDIAAMLKERYGVKQVYLYGSLAWGGFDRHSDIDLYLTGLEGNYWRALSEAETIASPLEVSLACEENCLQALKEKVLTKGFLL